ncbi:MAG: heavy-metal-associated domain-containing protein [Salinibacter sp.]
MPATDVRFRVPDMHCEGCADRVTTVLERLGGVRSAEVSLDDKAAEVKVADDSVDVDDLTAAVETAGYPEPA